MATLNITPTDATLGAIVTDVQLGAVDDSNWAAIKAAWVEYGVLIFPDQHLDEAEQVSVGQRMGDIEVLVPKRKAVPISNRRADGSLVDAADHHYQILRGNEGWHTDSSYMPVAAKASILSAQVVPPVGGETEWADMRAAYVALDAATKDRIASLSAYHSLYHSQSKIGHKASQGSSYGLGEQDPPLRPLVKVHPETGRPSLFIGRHAYGIPGLSEEESEQLLTDLVTFACQPPRIYTHQWQPGDVVFWDNRCLLHRARPYDFSQTRVMRHVRVAGELVSESGIA